MNLKSFLSQYNHLDLIADSRKANDHSLFFAIKGTHTDSHDFLKEVHSKGCRHFVVEDDSNLKSFSGIQVLKVPHSKQAWAEAWTLKTNHPDMSMFILGVTGTNGKTSVTMMVEHMLTAAGLNCGVMGTIDHHLKVKDKTKVWPTGLTTPGAEILFPRLQEMKSLGADAVALEISSHALDQKRAEGLNVDAAIFSNLTEDHLDYHKDLQHYFDSKTLLFEDLLLNSEKKNKVSVLNYSDPWILKYLPSFGKVELLLEVKSFEQLEADKQVQLVLSKIKSLTHVKLNLVKIKEHNLKGLKIDVLLDYNSKTKNQVSFDLPILGHFQAINWSQAFLACKDQVKDLSVFVKAAETFSGVPGRLQKVLTSKDKAVFVDYAHTPDALDRTLKSLKEVCRGQLIVVFGCGGDRDTTKRPLMAKVTANQADVQIVTNDNPRTEDPTQILDDILKGFQTTKAKPIVELDRKKAIQLGIEKLKSPEDVLLIAGKGHENYQILKDGTIDFSDYKTAESFINS